MNYRELVNEAIRESGTKLTLLSTGSDFTNPSDPMQIRFKNWVARAWKEIQMSRGEWHYMTKSAVFNLSPRIYVENGSRATAPAAGYTYTTNETLVDMEVLSVDTLSGSWSLGTAKAYIDLLTLDGNYKLRETADETSPDITETDVFTIMDRGKYDLVDYVADLDEIQQENFYVQSTGNSTSQDNDSNANLYKLQFVPWAQWNNWIRITPINGQPMYYTQNPEGLYMFWPDLNKQYTFKVNYITAPVSLSVEADEPDIPEQYHDVVVWRAVMFWAQYDQRPQDELTAFKNYRFYKRQLDRYKKPNISFQESKFNG